MLAFSNILTSDHLIPEFVSNKLTEYIVITIEVLIKLKNIEEKRENQKQRLLEHEISGNATLQKSKDTLPQLSNEQR